MLSVSTAHICDWQTVLRDWNRDLESRLAPKTIKDYNAQFVIFLRWVESEKLSLSDFKPRHMREYVARRRETGGRTGTGVGMQTLHTDVAIVKIFMKFAYQEKYINADPLGEYVAPKPAEAYVYCPTPEDLRRFLAAAVDRWNPAKNADVRFTSPKQRKFFAARDYALYTGMIETGARIGEVLSLGMDDYRAQELQIAIRETKGKEPRVIAFTETWRDIVSAWLKVRPRCESRLLFFNQFGDPIDPNTLDKQFRKICTYAGLPKDFHPHCLRHYAISTMAKIDVLMASNNAGHKDLKVTQKYIHKDADHMRAKHAEAAPLGKILMTKRTADKAKVRRRVL